MWSIPKTGPAGVSTKVLQEVWPVDSEAISYGTVAHALFSSRSLALEEASCCAMDKPLERLADRGRPPVSGVPESSWKWPAKSVFSAAS